MPLHSAESYSRQSPLLQVHLDLNPMLENRINCAFPRSLSKRLEENRWAWRQVLPGNWVAAGGRAERCWRTRLVWQSSTLTEVKVSEQCGTQVVFKLNCLHNPCASSWTARPTIPYHPWVFSDPYLCIFFGKWFFLAFAGWARGWGFTQIYFGSLWMIWYCARMTVKYLKLRSSIRDETSQL